MHKFARHRLSAIGLDSRVGFAPKSLPISLVALFSLISGLVTLPYLHHGLVLFDDGVYAWMAGRVADGAVLHKDIPSSHPGYQQLLHGFLYNLFGANVLTLRYPLPLLAVANAAFAIQLFRRAGVLLQIAALTITTGLGFLLFNNPSTNWSCLTIALAIATLLRPETAPPNHYRIFAIGLLLGLCFGIRHPTAVILGMATITALILSEPKESRPSWKNLSSTIFPILTLLATAVCSFSSGPVADRLLWAAPALALSVISLGHSVYIAPQPFFRRLISIFLGFLIGITPLIFYLTNNTAWPAFILDMENSLKIGATYSQSIGSTFSNLIIEAITIPRNATQALCCAVIIIIALSPLVISIHLIHSRIRSNSLPQWTIPVSPIIVIGSFYSLVAMVLPGEIYLAFTASILSLSILSLASIYAKNRSVNFTIGGIGILVGIIGFSGMSGNMVGGSAAGLYGVRTKFSEPCPLPKCNLVLSHIQAAELADVYSRIVATRPIPDELIGIPSGYAFNFFTSRKGDPELIFLRASFGEDGTAIAAAKVSAKPCALILREKNAGRSFDQKLVKILNKTMVKISSTSNFELLRNNYNECLPSSE